MTETATSFSGAGITAIVLLQAIVGAAVLYGVYRWMKRRAAPVVLGAIHCDGDGGTVVPVMATFAGVRGLPWWFAVAANNANPRFVIRAETIAYRVIRKRERRIGEIERIDIRTAWKTVNIELRFHGRAIVFAANVGTPAAARAVLGLFPPGIAMSDRAISVLDGSDAAPPGR